MDDKLKKEIKAIAEAYAIKMSAAPSDWEHIEQHFIAGVVAVVASPAKYGLQRRKSPGAPLASLEEIRAYMAEYTSGSWSEAQLDLQSGTFFDYYSANGWKVGGKAPMKDWEAAVRNWVRSESKKTTGQHGGNRTYKQSVNASNGRPFGKEW